MVELGQGMHDYDAALVAFLNGDGEGPAVVRRLAETVAEGRMLDEQELTELNELLGRTPVTARLVDGGEGRYALEMRTVVDDPDRELAGSFASLLRRAPDRLKRCEECGRYLLDSTRSRTQRWCTPQCGDRARVRAHRARVSQ
ncbi:MAG TPA: CGNR zinc finger domain-containing protein [Gaiellaceae bacterium]|nr:CGNR zinc finger domain-containing protein [Gaiellaceae bacterium]